MRLHSLGSLLVLSACYRGEAPSVERPQPLVQLPACSTDDDLAHPVIDSRDGRLRMHSSAPLTAVKNRAGGRTWTGPQVPDYIPKQVATLELMLLDQVPGGYLALYRDPYNVGSCQLGTDTNCEYEARHYRDGRLAWTVPLNRLLSRADHLEVQDIRLSGDMLYFNEACQSYSSEAGGDCSSLVAVDPKKGRVLWRTPSLISNNRFFVRGCYIVAGYGFTSEPDAVHLVDRRTGQVVQRLPVSSAPSGYRPMDASTIDIELYSGLQRRYRLDNVLATGGKLVPLDPDGGFGGNVYGGGAYGGTTYGP